jgi:hypothetical protein
MAGRQRWRHVPRLGTQRVKGSSMGVGGDERLPLAPAASPSKLLGHNFNLRYPEA